MSIRGIAVWLLVVAACCLVGLAVLPAAAAAAEGPAGMEGSGTEADPYEITNVTQLQAMEEDLDAHYVLVGNVDASATADWNGGSGFDPIGDDASGFTGSLDGGGHAIEKLVIDRSSTASGDGEDAALFVAVTDASISDVGIVDADIAAGGGADGADGEHYVDGNTDGTDGEAGGDGGAAAGFAIRQTGGTMSRTFVANATIVAGGGGDGGAGGYGMDAGADGGAGGAGGAAGGLVVENEGIVRESSVSDSVVASGPGGSGGAGGNNRGNGKGIGGPGASGGDSAGLVVQNDGSVRSSYVAATDASAGDGGAGGDTPADAHGVDGGDGGDSAGLAAANVGTVNASYVVGTDAVPGEGGNGGDVNFVGRNPGSSGETGVGGGFVAVNSHTIDRGYWDRAGSPHLEGDGVGAGSGGGVVSLETSELHGFAAPIYTSLDFDETWYPTASHPALSWESRDELTVDSLDSGDMAATVGVAGEIQVTPIGADGPVGEGATVTVIDAGGIGGIATGDSVVTDADGDATFGFEEAVPGEYDLVFAWDADGTVTTTTTVSVHAADSLAVEMQHLESSAGDPLAGQPTVIVTDRNGAPVPDVDVTAVRSDGSAFRSGTTTVSTNETGAVTFDDLVVADAGEHRLEFAIDGDDENVVSGGSVVESPAFTVAAAPADSLVVDSIPDASTAGEAISVRVSATDEFDNPAAGQTLDLEMISEHDGTVVDQTVTLDAAGASIVTVGTDEVTTAAGAHGMHLTADGLAGADWNATVEPADPHQLQYRTQPADATAGAPIEAADGTPITVTVRDVYGNIATDATIEPAVSVGSGNGSLVGDGPKVDVTDGVARVSDVVIESAGEHTLEVSGGELVSNTSDPFVIDPEAVATTSLDPGDTSITAGETVAFDATGRDQYGNLVSEDESEFVWANATGTGVFEKTTTGNYTVTATHRTTGIARTVTVSVGPGAPATLDAFDATETVGTRGSITVTSTDDVGNPVPGVQINVTDAGGLGGLSVGKTASTDASGTAALGFQASSPGEYRVEFEAGENSTGEASANVSIAPLPQSPGGSPPPLSIEHIDGGAAGEIALVVENAEQGDVIEIGGDGVGGSGDLRTTGNASIDGIAIEMAQDRTFELNVAGGESAVTSGGAAGTSIAEVERTFALATGTQSVGFLRVDHDLYSPDVESVTFAYTVPRERLDAAGAGSESVALHRLTDGEWERLPTTRTGHNDTHVSFESVSSGFSTFAIGADAAVFDVTGVGIGAESTDDAETIETGTSVPVTATVENVGREDGRFDGSLLANGATVAGVSVDVGAGESRGVTATHTFETAGSYDLCLESSCVTVAVDSAGEGGAGETGDSSGDETDTEAGSEEAESETGDEADGTGGEAGNDGSDDGLPGFGAVAALVSIVLVAAGLARRS